MFVCVQVSPAGGPSLPPGPRGDGISTAAHSPHIPHTLRTTPTLSEGTSTPPQIIQLNTHLSGRGGSKRGEEDLCIRVRTLRKENSLTIVFAWRQFV